MSTPATNASQGKRFKVALSFPGEHRDYIKEVADHLAYEYGKPNVFYDNFHKDELARNNLDIYLLNIYKDDSELVAYFLCEDYANKEWCGVEWRAIRDMIKHKKDDELMPFRFDDCPIDGALSIDGYIDLRGITPKDAAEYIIKRISKNDIAAIKKQSFTNTEDGLSLLRGIEKELHALKQTNIIDPNPELEAKIEELTKEKEGLQKELYQTKEILEKQEKEGKELIKLLEADKEKSALKQKALEAVEAKNYDEAENLLLKSAEDRIKQVASDFYGLGKIKELKLEYYEALKYYELAAQISIDNSMYCHEAGKICMTLGYLKKGLIFIEKSLELDLKQFGQCSEEVAINYNELGVIYGELGQLDKAIYYHEKALKIDLYLFKDVNFNVARDYNNLGGIWHYKGNFDKALLYQNKALVIVSTLLGDEHPRTATYYNNVGFILERKGNLLEAIDYYEKALKIDSKQFGAEHPSIAIRFVNLGLVWQRKGKLDLALEYFNNALQIDIKFFGKDNFRVAIDYNNLGMLWMDKGDIEKALEYSKVALEIDLQLYGERNPNTARDYNNVGMVFNKKRDLINALYYAQKSYSLFLELYGADNPSTITAKKNLDWYLKLKRDKV